MSKEFSWSSEKLIKEVVISEREKREIKICELDGKSFINFTTLKFFKNQWNVTAGYSIPKAHWTEIYDAVNDHDLKDAFGTSDSKIVLKGLKKDTEGKTEEPKKTTKAPRKSTKKAGDK